MTTPGKIIWYLIDNLVMLEGDFIGQFPAAAQGAGET